MNTATMSYGVRARERMPFAWDPVTLGLTAALLLVGIVMVTSASMSIAAQGFRRSVLFPGAAVHVCHGGCAVRLGA